MSLAEISQNHIRRNGQLSQSPAIQRESRPYAGLSFGDENAGISRKPSSIQSMLRNTTETGDVGRSFIKPSRLTTSSPRLSSASNRTQATPSRHRHPAPYHPEPHDYSGHQGAESPQHGSAAINGSGFLRQGRRGRHRMPSFEDYQSYSMAQGSYSSQTLNNRYMYANGPNHDRAAMQKHRPHSPFAYPTRLKRPGYRPSSPALSELNKSMAGQGQTFVHDPSSRTNSPSSAYNMNRTPSPFRYIVDRSESNLQHYPSKFGMESRRNRSPSTSSTHPPTPKPTTSLRSKPSLARLQRKRSATNGSWLHPQSSPVSPIFYDYTEEFEDQDNCVNTSMSSKYLADHRAPFIESSNDSELRESPNSTGVAELSSEPSPQKLKPQHYEAFNQSTLEMDMLGDGFTQTAPQDLSDVPELPDKEMAATEADHPLNASQHRWYEKSVHRLLPKSTSLPNVQAAQHLVPEKENRSRGYPQEIAGDPRSLIISQAIIRDSTSPVAPMFSSKRFVPPEPKFTTPKPIHSPTLTLHSQVKPETPAHHFDPEHMSGVVDAAHPLESSCRPSFECHSRLSTEILSPTPERSIISPSIRDRFSRILSIEEGPLDLDIPVSKDERVDSPMQGTHSSHIGQSGTTGPSCSNGSPYIGRNPRKHSVASGAVTEKPDYDSEEEPELTVALRQTFCKGDDNILQQYKSSPPNELPSQLKNYRLSLTGTVRRSSVIQGSPAIVSTRQNEPDPVTDENVDLAKTSTTHLVESTPTKLAPAVEKELPQLPRKQVSLRSFSPTVESGPFDLPFDFIPLIHRPSENDSIAEPEASPLLLQKGPTTEEEKSVSSVHSEGNPFQAIREDEINKYSGSFREAQNKRDSATSPHASVGSQPGSRPWNLDSSYPWDNQLPELEVMMPQSTVELQKPVERTPRFRLRIHRASSSAGGTKFTKELPPLGFPGSPFPSSHDLIQGPSFRRKRNPNLSVLPGQINSSHDMIQSSRQKTRFVETFETQSPTISLQPPSPGYEVRSFFSDDSSQMRPKPSFIKRFSGYRARTAAARTTSADETRTYDRGLLSSALGRSRASGRSSRQSRNTGRSSRQSHYTTGPSLRSSRARRTRWKVLDKVRKWLYREGEGVPGLGWTRGYRRDKSRSASTPLYAGV